MRGICFSQESKYNDKRKQKEKNQEKYRKEKSNTLSSHILLRKKHL